MKAEGYFQRSVLESFMTTAKSERIYIRSGLTNSACDRDQAGT